MKHFGDITKLSGYVLPIVDVITGGSPCQDLSVAGKRAGLAGERSGLFMEQMRIVKEMRERDVRDGRPAQYVRPRYMVWENVPGAFSSGSPKGSDFQAVLEEIVRVVCKEVPPVPIPKDGWSKAGCISGVGDSGCTFSIAWRVHDAQFWGVPQRRKRIALVADFGGLSAPEILFERKGLSGYPEPGAAARKRTAGATESRIGKASSFTYRGRENGCNVEMQDELAYALRNPSGGGSQPNVLITAGATGSGVEGASGAMNPWDPQSARVYQDNGVRHSLNANENGGQSRDAVFCLQGNGIDRASGKTLLSIHQNASGEVHVSQTAYTVSTNQNASGRNTPIVYENHSQDSRYRPLGETCETVNAKYGTGGNNQPLVVSDVLPFDTTQITSPQNGNNPHYGDPCHPLAAQAHVPSIANPSIIRRLTPQECERIQGYPDGWTDIGEWTDSKGKKHKEADSPRYKALGNSIALPFWAWLARRICAQYERPATMASLFDGIGGFPLVFQRSGAVPVWASEIEEFPIAVTKKHFPEE